MTVLDAIALPKVAVQLGKTEAACREMVHRASERVQQARTRFEVPRDVHHQLLQRFMVAAHSGDRNAIEALLSEDAQLIGDGKVPSFPKPLVGPFRIANLYWALFLRLGAQVVYRMALINGEPGLLYYANGRLDHQLSPKAFIGLVNLSDTVKKGPLGLRLTELVFLRVSQINGCAYCMDMRWSRTAWRHAPQPCKRRRIRPAAGCVQRCGNLRPGLCDCDHQRLEPDQRGRARTDS